MSKHILIAEDEAPLASVLKLKLVNAGYEVEVARTGEEALTLFSGGQTYDLIILDLIMPDVNGFEVLEKLKEAGTPVPPVIVLTNLAQSEDQERVKELGATKYFVKSSVPLKEVVSEVQAIIGEA